jgi:LysR family hydrogen peroxide-inducible transcriptional activator
MTLSELRYIVAVARERHFRRAAERCFVSQPALSAAVAKLEDELGVKLFERSKSEVSVTPVGALVVEQAQRVLDEAERIREIAGSGRDPLVGALKLGAIFTVGPYLFPSLIPAVKAAAPNMPLQVEENLTSNLTTLLREGNLDAILVAEPFDVPGIATEPLYDEDFVGVVAADHPLAGQTRIRPEQLVSERILRLGEGHCFASQVSMLCPELDPNSEVQHGNSLETLRNMVASGLGVTLLPASAACGGYANPMVRCIPFDAPAPSRRIVLAWRKRGVREKAIATLAEAVRSIEAPWKRVIAAPAARLAPPLAPHTQQVPV